MKRLALLLALIPTVAFGQLWDSVRTTDTPNGGRQRINWSFQHVADSVAGLASGQTPTAIFTKYTSIPRHIPTTSAQWMDSLKATTGSVSSPYGNLLRIVQGQGTLASSYYVKSWYPTTTGHSSTGGDGYTTGQLLETLDPTPTRAGFQTYRDSSNNLIIGRHGSAAALNSAIIGGDGLDIRMIPDRVYGGVTIGNRLDANGNLVFDPGESGGSYTSPHGLLNVYRRGVRGSDGSLNYMDGDDVYAIKAEHHFENTSKTVHGGAVQGWSYFSGASKATNASGFGGGIWSTSSAQLGRMMAGDFNVYLNNASGIIDTAYGLRVYTSIGPLGGTISNSYGIYVSPLAGTKRYAGYFAGTTDSVVVEGVVRLQKLRFNDGTTMTTAATGGGGGTWGTITGALPSQGDLTDTLNNRKTFTQVVKDTVEAVKARAYLSTLTTDHMLWLDGTTLKNVTVTGAGGSFSAGTLTLSGGGGAGTWGTITGTLNDQTDLKDTLVNRKTFTQVVKDTGDARYNRTARLDSAGHSTKTATTEKLYLDIVGGNLTVKVGTDQTGGAGSASWGGITTGTGIPSQTDLYDTLNNRKVFTQMVKDSVQKLMDSVNARTNRTAAFDSAGLSGKTSTTGKLYGEVVGGKLTVKVGTDQTGGGGGTWGTITGTLTAQTDLRDSLANHKNWIFYNLDSIAAHRSRLWALYDSNLTRRTNIGVVNDSIVAHRNRIWALYDSVLTRKLNIYVQGDSLVALRNRIWALYDSNLTRRSNIFVQGDSLVAHKNRLWSLYDSNLTRRNNIGVTNDSVVAHKNRIWALYDSATTQRVNLQKMYGIGALNANYVWKQDATGLADWRVDAQGAGAGGSGTLDSIYTGSTFITTTRMTDSTYRIGFDSTKFRTMDTTNFQVARGHTGYVVGVDNNNPGGFTIREILSPYKRTMAGSANWSALRYHSLGLKTQLTTSTMASTSGNFTAFPFTVPFDMTIDTLRWEVSTASATAGFCFGIYSNESDTVLYPSARLTAAVVYDTASVGVKVKYAGSDITLYAGQIYWLAYASNSATPVVRGYAVSSMENFLGANPVLGTNNFYTCVRVARAYDWTLPASAPTTCIPIANIQMPQILARIK